MKVAVLMTVFNRIDKTLACLRSLFNATTSETGIQFKVFITDDGSTDNTYERLKQMFPGRPIEILFGTGQLFWNGGMIRSWLRAVSEGGYDGYLWLNNDSVTFPNLWSEIAAADIYARNTFGKGGIYVGSTCNPERRALTYGGFNFVNKWTLKDKFLIPDGTFQRCQAAHGNITFVSHEVVAKEGIFCDKYQHSGSDHDYSYRAYRHGFPVFILRDYVGECENDHLENNGSDFINLPLRQRFDYLRSPLGFNLNNTLLFQRRCFPYRYLPVWIAGYAKALFPKLYFRLYRRFRNKN